MQKNSSMHVGFFIDAYFPVIDGVIRVTDAYASRLVGKCDVTVFTPLTRGLDPGYDSRFPYEVVRCKSVMRETDDYPQGFPIFDPGFKARVRAAKLDLIHIHSAYPMGQFAKSFARRHHIPMVGTLHSDFRPDVVSLLGKGLGERIVRFMMTAYNACDECWTVNDAVGRMFQKDYGLKRPYRVMPYSTDHTPVADVAAACSQVNARFGLKDDDFVLTHVGRLDLQKREDFILRSLAELKKSLGDFKMLFIGDGYKRGFLEEMAQSLGLGDNVIFGGILPDPESLMNVYARTDLLLFPSSSDTYGLVKIEAACQNTPTLFCRGTMAADGIRDGVNGFIAEDDEQSFAASIRRLSGERRRIAEVGAGARRDLYRTWDAIAESVYENYLNVIENHKS